MAKFEALVVVRRQLQVEFGENTLTEAPIKPTFDRFCATGTAEDRDHPDRPSKITEQKIDEIHDVIQDELQSSIRAVTTICSVLPTTAYRITSENFELNRSRCNSPNNTIKTTYKIELTCVRR